MAGDIGQQREDHHTEGFAADVGNGIQRNLPAVEGGKIATQFRGPSVRGFVARGGKQEHHVPHQARDQELRIHLDSMDL
jgi:hypothetical protein